MPAQWGVSCVLPSALKRLKDNVNALHAHAILSAYCMLPVVWAQMCGLRGRENKIKQTDSDRRGKWAEPASLWQVKMVVSEAAPPLDLDDCSWNHRNVIWENKHQQSTLLLVIHFYSDLRNNEACWGPTSLISCIPNARECTYVGLDKRFQCSTVSNALVYALCRIMPS